MCAAGNYENTICKSKSVLARASVANHRKAGCTMGERKSARNMGRVARKLKRPDGNTCTRRSKITIEDTGEADEMNEEEFAALIIVLVFFWALFD